jgi:hypothetical protein
MDSTPYSPEHWLAQAEDARAIAELMKEPHTRRSMLYLARGYEKLAEHAQEQAGLMAQIETPERKRE